jgi:eukaryotic-like serine/threonine-protein kinase
MSPMSPMSDVRWQRANGLFHAALEREVSARESFLREACGGDAELYGDVASLIAADEDTPNGALERLGEEMAADWAAGTAPASLVGQRVDRYQVVAHLGSGGMGDVYRATDTVLGRDVALKVLTPALHADAEFRRRLEKEGRAASSLNHPNIVTVYEIGQAGPIDFVASELVDGVTLRVRLTAGPLPLRELVDIGSQIAAALSSAHGAGIVHRDIKPENVMIRRDGIVKVVDFGLAKRTGPRAATEHPSTWLELTGTGVVAGTACYMSPEQALGEPVDPRSDLFSVGILLYEMATSHRPFDGASDAAMYEALRHTAPPAPTSVRPELPVELDLVIDRALEKEPELRYQSAADLAADLKRLQRPSSSASLAAVSPRRPRRTPTPAWRTVAIAALLLVSILAVVALVVRRPLVDAPTTRFTVGPPPNAMFTLAGLVPPAMTVSVSPDGRHVLYLANRPGARGRLWLRSIDSVDATPIDDTDGATYPFWSPDSRSVAFFVDGTLKRKELAGGTPRTLAQNTNARGGTWGRDGVILFGTAEGGISRVPAAGGTASAVTTPDRAHGESWHRFPQVLPDGRHFLYLARSGDTRTLYAGSLDQRVKKRLVDTNVRAEYAEAGYLFFVAGEGALMARPFDVSRLEFTGEAVQVASHVAFSSALDASFGVGGATLAYAEQTAATSLLTWFDRSGQTAGPIGTAGQHIGVRLSPDGNTAAVTRSDPNVNMPDIWLLDISRSAESRFTFNPWPDMSPVWSPDGARVVFSSSRNVRFQVFQRPAAGGAEEIPLFTSEDSAYPDDWSPDGQFIVYSTNPPGRNADLKLLRTGDLRSTTLLASRFSEYQGRISPDGRWLAYTSDETGRPEIYLRPFPVGTSSVVISVGGGSEPSWRRDGKELFYLAADGGLMSVALTATDVVKASRPSELFRTHIPGDRHRNGTSYAATADGRRFLVTTAVGDPPQAAITVMLNWVQAVQR